MIKKRREKEEKLSSQHEYRHKLNVINQGQWIRDYQSHVSLARVKEKKKEKRKKKKKPTKIQTSIRKIHDKKRKINKNI